MVESIYSSLPKDPFSIRLLRIIPSMDPLLPIHCNIVIYPLNARPTDPHSYEALSYAWGTSKNSQTIWVESVALVHEVQVTQNLHAALLKLRNPYFERIIWIDALCINQNDNKEKDHQVSAMARIYGLARRVVVWLGEEDDDSTLAFQELGELASKGQVAIEENVTNEATSTLDPVYDSSTSAVNQETPTSLVKGQFAVVSDDHHDDKCRSRRRYDKAMRKKREKAILALLERRYFRRIWVLQELAAARKLHFMCGGAELHGKIFRKGLVALDTGELVLQYRFRAITALLDYSSLRKNMKGEPHLNIQPLTQLVDMFHAHEATDRRDKVYALLGMCSDHELAKSLEPDYSKEWTELFEELGRFIFGPCSLISASKNEEMLYISTRSFVLGWVSEVAMAGSWSNTQTLRIQSFTSDRLFDGLNWWNTRCRLPVLGKEIRKEDIVLLSETLRKIVIVRPTTLYLSIIAVTDSQSVYTEDKGDPDGWKTWLPYLESVGGCLLTLRLIWNWNVGHETETQVALQLMQVSSSSVPATQQEDYTRANALYDMANLALHCHRYDDASKILESAALVGTAIHALKHQFAMKVQDQYIKIAQYASRYHKALHWLPVWLEEKHKGSCQMSNGTMPKESSSIPDEVAWHFCAILVNTYVWGCSSRKIQYPGPISNWCTYAAKALVHTIKADTLQKVAGSRHPQDLELLISIEDSNKLLSSDVMLTVAQNLHFDKSHLSIVFRSAVVPFEGLSQLIKYLARFKEKSFNTLLRERLEVFGDHVTVDTGAIETALQYKSLEKETLSMLLSAAGDGLTISQRALSIAASNCQYHGIDLIVLLLERIGPNYTLSEMVLVATTQNKESGVHILMLFLERLDINLELTDIFLLETLRADSGRTKHKMFPRLRYLRGFKVTDAFISAANELTLGNNSPVKDEIHTIILDWKENKPVTQEEVESVVRNGEMGYIDMLALVKYRRCEFDITSQMVMAVIGRVPQRRSLVPKIQFPKICGSWNCSLCWDCSYLWPYFANPWTKMGLLLLRHTNDKDLSGIVSGTGVPRFAAYYGSSDILLHLHDRLGATRGDIGELCLVARLKRYIYQGEKSTEAEDLIENLTAYRSEHWLSITCNHALMVAVEECAGRVVNGLLEQCLADANFVDSLGRTPLRVATEQSVLDENIIRSLLKHGGGRSLDFKDCEGMTPRYCINERVRESRKETLWPNLLRDMPNKESFGTITGPDMVLLPPGSGPAPLISTQLAEDDQNLIVQ